MAYVETIGLNFRYHSETFEIEDIRTGVRRPDTDFVAKVDVYEDRVEKWFLDVAEAHTAKGQSPADYVALAICLSYIEGVEQYRRGNAARGQSQVRFKTSVRRVFPDVSAETADHLWNSVRCGLFHSGFTEGPTIVSYNGVSAIAVADGYLHVNPGAFVSAMKNDFAAYVSELRSNPESELARCFVRLWDDRWNATEPASGKRSG